MLSWRPHLDRLEHKESETNFTISKWETNLYVWISSWFKQICWNQSPHLATIWCNIGKHKSKTCSYLASTFKFHTYTCNRHPRDGLHRSPARTIVEQRLRRRFGRCGCKDSSWAWASRFGGSAGCRLASNGRSDDRRITGWFFHACPRCNHIIPRPCALYSEGAMVANQRCCTISWRIISCRHGLKPYNQEWDGCELKRIGPICVTKIPFNVYQVCLWSHGVQNHATLPTVALNDSFLYIKDIHDMI